MTLLDIREAILENVVRDDIASNRLDRYVNMSLQRMARYHNWRDLHVKATTPTVIDQGEYALPEGEHKIKDLISITLVDGDGADTKLTAVPYRRLHELVPNPSSTQSGKPRFYVIWDNVISLYPVPDAIYSLEILYVKWPDTMSLSTHTPEILGVDDVIISGATFQCFMSLQQKDDAAFWNQQFFTLLQEAAEGDIKHTDHALRLQGYRTSDKRVPSQEQPMA